MLPRISSDQILALLQSGDKAFLSGAGNRGNRFPIVFHAQNDPAFGHCLVPGFVDVLHTTKAGKLGPRVAFLPWTRAEPHIGLTSLEWLVRNACGHALRNMRLLEYLPDKKSK